MEGVKIVAVDDDPGVLNLVSRCLAQPAVEILKLSSAFKAAEIIRQELPDIVIADLRMPGMTGMELLEQVSGANIETDFVLLTADYSTETAVEAIQKGACDYITKPIDLGRFRARIDLLIDDARRRKHAALLELEILKTSRFAGMIGQSIEIENVFSTLRKVAPHTRSSLITGATGTGKELVADAMHRLSPVSDGPFVICSCAAVVDTIFESELFGSVKGAFTGAYHDRVGLFEAANGGTLFLDEIGEVPLTTQSKLLRVLQFGEVRPVGANVSRKVNVHVIAATNRNLREMVQQHQFRGDLFYRLALVQIHIPPLAARGGDLPLLTAHFVEHFSHQYNKDIRGLTQRAKTVVSRYAWPGNVRELENAISHACMMTTSDVIDVADLPDHVCAFASRPAVGDADLLPLAEVERRHVRFVLEKVGGNKALAAEYLGISRSTLYKFI